MTPETWLFADVGALVWQEFHGAARREPRAAVAGLAARVLELARLHGAGGRVLWACDAGPYLRAALLPGYKAARRDDDPAKAALRTLLAKLPAALRAYGACVAARRGFEADDLIAAGVAALPPGARAVVASRDRDLLQLVGPRAVLFDPRENRSYGRSWFRAEYGLHPREWADAKALAGCAADGVPGCPGVGLKTAVAYLTGRLPRHSARFAALREWEGSAAHALSAVLVRLPYPGTPAPILRPGAAVEPAALLRGLARVPDA